MVRNFAPTLSRVSDCCLICCVYRPICPEHIVQGITEVGTVKKKKQPECCKKYKPAAGI